MNEGTLARSSFESILMGGVRVTLALITSFHLSRWLGTPAGATCAAKAISTLDGVGFFISRL